MSGVDTVEPHLSCEVCTEQLQNAQARVRELEEVLRVIAEGEEPGAGDPFDWRQIITDIRGYAEKERKR